MNIESFDLLRKELSVKAKNGVDFITAATLLWLAITVIWAMGFSAYNKSIFTFMVSGIMLPLAFAFSKVYRTKWSIKGNPLQPLGLVLNLAQLFYFPFLIFILIKSPEYFVMTYAIITGAHFFPYFWFYNEKAYAIFGGIISVGALCLGLTVSPEKMYYIPAVTAVCLFALAVIIFWSVKKANRLTS